MKRVFLLLLLALLSMVSTQNDDGGANGGDGGGGAQEQTGDLIPKSLVICLDGVRGDALANARTPIMDSLIEGEWQEGYNGAHTYDAQNVYDATGMSGPNHVAIVTGVTATKSGVSTNNNVDQGDFTTYPHYMQRLKTYQPTLMAAMFTGWEIDMLIPSGADYQVIGPSGQLVEDGAALLRGGYVDVSSSARCEYREHGLCWEHACFADAYGENCPQKCDRFKENCKTGAWKSDSDPDLTYFFLDNPDNPSHSYGFNDINDDEDDAYRARIEAADAQIGQFLQAIESRADFAKENWQIIVTSDHGGYQIQYQQDSSTQFAIPAHTVPFLISSRDVTQGRLPWKTHNYDVAPTVLEHFGYILPGTEYNNNVVKAAEDYDEYYEEEEEEEEEEEPEETTTQAPVIVIEFDGSVRGIEDVEEVQKIDLEGDLVGYYRFEKNYNDASGQGHNATLGGDLVPSLFNDGGRYGSGYMSVGAGSSGDGSSYLTVEDNKDYDFESCENSWSTSCKTHEFTIALWYRPHATKKGISKKIIGNKNWGLEETDSSASSNPGWMLLTRQISVLNNNGKELKSMWALNFNAGDTAGGLGARALLPEPIQAEKNAIEGTGDEESHEWIMVAATVNKKGLMQVYSGADDGYLHWTNTEFEQGTLDDLVSGYPVNIGNDGVAGYNVNMDADVDDVMIWRRALTREEIEALYNEGQPLALWVDACVANGGWPSVPAGGKAILKSDCGRGYQKVRHCVVEEKGGDANGENWIAKWGEASGCQSEYAEGFEWNANMTIGVALAGGIMVLLLGCCVWRFYFKKKSDYETIDDVKGIESAQPTSSSVGRAPMHQAPHHQRTTTPQSTAFSEATVE